MDQKLTEFVSLLRKNGLKVSPPEVMDAVSAISLLGYDDRAIYRQALATTLSKSAADYPIFERCFEHFFCITPTPAEPAEKTAAPPFNLPAGLQFLFGKGEGASSGGQGAGQPIPSVPPSALGEQLLNQPDRIELELAQAIEKANLASIKVMTQQGLFGRRILMAMGLDDLERELAQLDGSAHPTAAKRAEQLRQKRDQLRTQIKETVQRYFRLAAPNNRDEIIRETPLNLLQESKDTRAIIQRMAKKLITQHRRRQKKASRGLIDVRRTLRGNMANDGILIQPHWRHIHKDRPRVMAICDVSGSVSRYARFLLLFLYSLQEVIPHLRSFVFSSSLHEVTDFFETQPMEKAMETVLDKYGLGSTDYGRAFADFEKLALSCINRKTTLIILGDARNNRGDARADLLQTFHQRARQVIWLNPEAINRWGSGDSEMLRYRSYCTRAHSCHNLKDLEHIVNQLLRSA
mgnify:FL=1|jgi:hypothetical protein